MSRARFAGVVSLLATIVTATTVAVVLMLPLNIASLSAQGVEATVPATREEMQKHGVEHWARKNMARRLGGHFPPEGVEWWSKFMGRTALSTQLGFMGTIAVADIRGDLPKIACPTLVAVTEESALGTVEQTRAWQKTIPDSELVVLPGNSYHVAATHAEQCAKAALEFIGRRGTAPAR